MTNKKFATSLLAALIAISSFGGVAFARAIDPPEVRTLSALNVESDRATLTCDVVPNSMRTRMWFEYGETEDLGNFTPARTFRVKDGRTSILFRNHLSGLDADTTYFYRCMARNPVGITRGEILSFTTASQEVPSPSINVVFVSASAEKTFNGGVGGGLEGDEGLFTVVFDISAVGSDIYVPDGAASLSLAVGSKDGAGFTLNDGAVGGTSVAVLDHDGTNGVNGNFKVDENDTKRFTMTVLVIATKGSADFVSIALNSLGWSITDKSTADNIYTDLDGFVTPSIFLVPR